MTSEEQVKQDLERAENSLANALVAIDESTEYLQDELMQLYIGARELMNKMRRDEVLQKDRAAFAEPEGGLGEWVKGG
jgi:hypothetical protein